MKRHIFSLTAGWIVLAVMATQANAQVIIDPFGGNPFGGAVEVIVEESVAEAVVAESESSEDAKEETGEDAAAKKAKEKRDKERLDAINKLTFDRRPSAILKLWSAPPEEEKEEQAEEEKEPEAKTEPEKQTEDASDEEELSEEEKAKKAKEEAERLAKEKAEKERLEKEKQEKEQFTKTTKLLTASVTRGDWEQFGETLRDRELLSGKEAVAAYDRMLTQLGAQAGMDFSGVVGLSDDMKNFMQSLLGNRRNNPATAYAEKHIINVPDLLGIVRSAPLEAHEGYEEKDDKKDKESEGGEDPKQDKEDKPKKKNTKVALKDDKLQKIAGLLRLCLTAGNPLEEFTTAMKQGGEKLLTRQNVAVVLSRAGRDEETIDFLPTLEKAAEKENVQVLNLLAKHYLAMHRKDEKESLRVKAWKCTLAALEVDDPKKKTGRTEAMTRAVMLAPKLEDDLGKSWLQESFTEHADRGQEVLAKLGTATAQRLAQMPQDANTRAQNLELQAAAVQAFLDTETEIDDTWAGILNLLASNWLKEADVTRQHSSRSSYGSSMRRDRYGNLYYVDEQEMGMNAGQQMALRRINPVKVETILETAPLGTWFNVIDAGLQPKYTAMMCRLWLKVNEPEKAFPYIETLAPTNPETARELAEEFLRVWTKDHNPNQERQRTNYYMFIYGYEQKADKIPLTRSKQERNLKELSQWIERLRALPLEEDLDETLLVSAFMTCHSVAEVYGVEDIEEVFGAWGTIEAGTMAKLIDKMRTNLAGVWRDPNVQRDSKTKRKKNDIEAEVKRGYSVAKAVLDRALQQHPGNWQLLLSKACVMHDENDFIQEIDPSSEFSARRQAAFAVYSDAAKSYVGVAEDLPEREQTNEAFDRWFYASLGAADLGKVSEENRADKKQIALIKASLQSLKGDMGDRHRERFANSLFTRMSAVSPACKFRYLEAGFELVPEDNEKAEEAKKVYDYYKDLVTELELVTRIDGDARVGHEEPFGVYVDLKHTKELERESGGFAKYLQNQKGGYYYSYNYGRPTENYRDKFEDSTTAALEEHFEILSVTFNHSDTKSRDTGDGWRVTPYAYLLLKARGPEVDKLPALKIDLDFLDTSGYVVLPIESSPRPVDASESVGSSGSTEKLELVQLLDERQAAKGKLIVETKATARGLVPDLDALVDTKVPGFDLVETEDSDVSVIEFDKETSAPVVLSERTWTLTYAAADPAAPAPESFAFPSPSGEPDKVTYQRYVDADLEEVEATVALVQDYGSNQRAWVIAGLCGAAGLILLVAFVIGVRRTGNSEGDTGEVHEEALTPFGLLTRLREVEQANSLPGDRISQLGTDIAEIERHYFAESNGKAAPDLEVIARRWTTA